MLHFASQLRPSQQTTQSLRARQYKPSNKRRRDEQEDSEDPLDQLESSFVPSAPPLGLLSSGDDAEIPPPPFPHAPLKPLSSVPSAAKIQESIAALEPAVYAVHVTSQNDALAGNGERPALRKTHLHVLTTVMHRCLLEGDYCRASRAWGLLLRTQTTGGRHIDPRNHGRWGIGAELLLHRKVQSPEIQSRPQNNHHDDSEIPSDPEDEQDAPFTEEGLALARAYYDRFVIHYNHRRWLPNAVDNRIFYPPLFTIWIMDILDQSKRSRNQNQKELERMSSASMDSEVDGSLAQGRDAHAREAAVQAEELSNARKLCEKLDSLMNGPPYDKLPNWLCLRANVALWISDLLVGKGETGGHVISADLSDDDENIFSSGSNKSRAYARSIAELNEALIYFERAEENRAGNMDTARSSVEIKIKHLTKQMARFDG